MSNIDKQTLRQLAVDAKELAIIKRYTKGIEAHKKFIAVMTPATVLALLDELEAKDQTIAELEKRHAQVIHARDHYKSMVDERFRRINQGISLSINGEG